MSRYLYVTVMGLIVAVGVPATGNAITSAEDAWKIVAAANKVVAKSGVELLAKEPISGRTGQYMGAYRASGKVSAWVLRAIAAKEEGSWKSRTGETRSSWAVEGGGAPLRNNTGSKYVPSGDAIAAAGGWFYIKQTTNLSFEEVEELAVYLHINHATDEGYADVLAVAMEIYPELKRRYLIAVKKSVKASQKALKKAASASR